MLWIIVVLVIFVPASAILSSGSHGSADPGVPFCRRKRGLAVPGHHLPRDPEIEHEHGRSDQDAIPDVPPEAHRVLIAPQGRAAPHRHDPGPNAEVSEQPEGNDEELEWADEELKQKLASEPPGRHPERKECDD